MELVITNSKWSLPSLASTPCRSSTFHCYINPNVALLDHFSLVTNLTTTFGFVDFPPLLLCFLSPFFLLVKFWHNDYFFENLNLKVFKHWSETKKKMKMNIFFLYLALGQISWLKRSNSVKELAAFGIRSCLRTHGSQVRIKVRFCRQLMIKTNF